MPNESTRFAFTKRALEAIPAPEKGRRNYQDARCHGLVLRVTAAGNKTFALYRRIGGRPETVTIGRFPGMTIEQARREVGKLNGKIAAGGNPAEERRGLRQEATLGELFGLYLERHAKPRKRTWKDDDSLYRTHLSPWANRKLSSVSKADVRKLHADIAARSGTKRIKNAAGKTVVVKDGGPGAANHATRLLRAMFNHAVDWGWNGVNPAHKVKEVPTIARDRFLTKAEIPRLFTALADEPNETARDAIVAMLLTGARKANVLSMAWVDVDLDDKTWRIGVTKNGTPQTVAIAPALVELLEQRRAANTALDPEDRSPFVFPGKGAAGHVHNVDGAWARIITRAEIDDPRGTRLHDLRRTLGSWQAAAGASLAIIGKSLNHKSITATAVYARLDLDPVRASVEAAAANILDAAGLGTSADVVPMKKQGTGQ